MVGDGEAQACRLRVGEPTLREQWETTAAGKGRHAGPPPPHPPAQHVERAPPRPSSLPAARRGSHRLQKLLAGGGLAAVLRQEGAQAGGKRGAAHAGLQHADNLGACMHGARSGGAVHHGLGSPGVLQGTRARVSRCPPSLHAVRTS